MQVERTPQRNSDDGCSKKKKMRWRLKPPRWCSDGAGSTKGWHVVEEWTRCAALGEEEEVQNVWCCSVKTFGFF